MLLICQHPVMPSTVHLAVYDTLADWEAGLAVAHVNDGRYQREPGRYVVRTVAATAAPVVTMGGVRITPDLTLDELRPANSAMLVLPGAQGWDAGEHGAMAEAAGAFLEAGVPVAAICGATAGLARAGLLDTRRHTSNAAEYLAATGYAGGEHYVDAPAVRDGDLITASAVHPVEFAREVLARLDAYTPEVLDAWHGLYATGDPACFGRLMAAAG
jgi:putative intracellular protease/amidase